MDLHRVLACAVKSVKRLAKPIQPKAHVRPSFISVPPNLGFVLFREVLRVLPSPPLAGPFCQRASVTLCAATLSLAARGWQRAVDLHAR